MGRFRSEDNCMSIISVLAVLSACTEKKEDISVCDDENAVLISASSDEEDGDLLALQCFDEYIESGDNRRTKIAIDFLWEKKPEELWSDAAFTKWGLNVENLMRDKTQQPFTRVTAAVTLLEIGEPQKVKAAIDDIFDDANPAEVCPDLSQDTRFSGTDCSIYGAYEIAQATKPRSK
jgi:hypothetical protein